MPDLSPGYVVAGRYAIVRLLGRGATKTVYLADDKLTAQPVALALLDPADNADPTLAARFSREGKAASILRSPYVVHVFDVGKLPDGTRYLATEPVIGRGLDAAVAHGPVLPELAARWTCEVLAALAEAHARGIMHRDVKPENVMLDPSSGTEVAKLTDFGLAKVLDGNLEGSLNLRTAQNIVLGTPEYMAPEQWQGSVIDARTDVYSTGAMLYELLVGRAPFESPVLHAVCVAHMTAPVPPFPASVLPLSRALEPVVRRALEKHPVDRYASANAMREAIESVSGVRLEPVRHASTPAVRTRSARAEIIGDALPGVVTVVATPNVVFGRDASSHIVVHCLPGTDENVLKSRTISREHARIEWRGGRAFVVDLGSRTGTRVGDRVATREPVEIKSGDVLSLGKYVRMRFEHAVAEAGELPRWARLVRVDDHAGGQVYLLVLTEAKISAADDAALRLPRNLAAGDVVRIRAIDDDLVALTLGALEPMPLVDGQQLRIGSVVLEVAVDR